MSTKTITPAYIIADDSLIATVQTDLPAGASVRYSWQRCAEAIDANREFNLVNARRGKISRAKTWQKNDLYADSGVEINPGEFYLSSCV